MEHRRKPTTPLSSPMLNAERVDFVALDSKSGRVILAMLETRPWGDSGRNLPGLEAKINTYINYVNSGDLVRDFPAARDKGVTFRLQTTTILGDRDEAFILLVREKYLEPLKIGWETSMIG